MTEDRVGRPPLSADEQDRLLAQVVGGHALAETPLDDDAVDRIHRLARGELTVAEAYAEVDALYGSRRPDPPEGV